MPDPSSLQFVFEFTLGNKKNRRIIDEKTHNDTQGANMPKMRLKFKPEVKQSVFKENLN